MIGDLGESSRMQGFALGWMLSERWGNAMTGYLNEPYLEDRNRSRLKL